MTKKELEKEFKELETYADNSKAMFAKAVKLDKELKEYGNED